VAREEQLPANQPRSEGRFSAAAASRMTRVFQETINTTQLAPTTEAKIYTPEVATATRGPGISQLTHHMALADSALRINTQLAKEETVTKEPTLAPITTRTTSIRSKWNFKTCSSRTTKTIPMQDTP